MGELVTQHVNSEGERVSIERVLTGDFVGQLLLVVYDDPPLSTTAPMLLDEGTRAWLLAALTGGLLVTESMALTVARAQASRGGPVPPNTAMMLVMAIDRLTGSHDWTAEGEEE